MVGKPSLIGKVRFARDPTGIRTQPLQVVSAIGDFNHVLKPISLNQSEL